MAYWNWNRFKWLSNDTFEWREWELLECLSVDLIETPWYVTGKKNRWNLTSSPIAINYCKDSTTYPMFWSTTWGAYLWFWFVNCLDSGSWTIYAKSVEQIWTTTLPVTYWFQDTKITQQAYNWSSFTFNQDITTNVPTWDKTATCVWAGRIYFAVWNRIKVINTTVSPTTTLSTVNLTDANDKIPFWYTIKYIYINMDIMNVVATDWRDTIIYQLTETSTDVWDIRYYHRKKGAVCISAVWDWSNIYWITKNSIYLSNWVDSQKVRSFKTSVFESGFCTFYNWILKIAVPSAAQVYEYWHYIPWYSDILIKHSSWFSVTSMDWDIMTLNNASNNYATRISSDFNNYAYQFDIASLPYYANDLLQKKEWTYIRIWHILPAYSLYTSTSQLCGLTVWVLTDTMEQKWRTTHVTVATITTPTSWVSERFTDITTQEIISAISSAWYDPDFSYISLKISWISWDPITLTWFWTAYRKTPIFLWAKLSHNEIKKWW